MIIAPSSRDLLTRPAFTLAEMLVGMAATSMLLAGISSAIFFATRAAAPDTVTMQVLDGALVAEDLVADVQSATSFSERSATAVEFTVADRDGDGQAETIRYAWLGAAGSAGPLVRQINGGAEQILLELVPHCQLDYVTQLVSEEIPQTSESAEIELFSHDPGGSDDSYSVGPSRWRCQYFQPTLPPEALSWKVTRVSFRARQDEDSEEEGSGASVHVQLRSAASAAYDPANLVLEEVVLANSNFSESYTWLQLPLSSVANRSPKEGLCISFVTSDGTICELAKTDTTKPRAKLWESINQGASWLELSNRILSFYVYGTYTTAAPPLTKNHEFLTAVRLTLQVGEGQTGTLQTAAHLLNPVELTVP